MINEVLENTKRKYISFPRGMNMSIIQKGDTYECLGIIRQPVKLTNNKYPEVQNIQFILHFDFFFEITKCIQCTEPERTKYISFTTGLEDCRIISESMIVAVLLDTNPHWIPQISFCQFNSENAIISKITPMTFTEDPNRPQKNWIFLNQEEDTYFMIFSYSPIQIISCHIDRGLAVLMKTGKNKIELPVEYEESHFHGGAAVLLETNQYLVVIRIVKRHEYKSSMWLLLDSTYEMIGYSPPFVFQERDTNEFFYEMCMSLSIRDKETLLGSVSISDKNVFIYEMDLSQILLSIKKIEGEKGEKEENKEEEAK